MTSHAWFILPTLLLAAAGCSPSRYDYRPAEQELVTTVTVECNADVQAQTAAQQLLRTVRVSEWNIRDIGGSKEIEARYRSITERQLFDLTERLKQIPGIMNVEIKKDERPLKNIL